MALSSLPIRRAGRPSGQAAVRLFCLPPAGAGPSIFYPWLDAAPARIEVCPVAVPGREDLMRAPLPASIDALADHLAEALLPALDRPFALLGYSMGALVAYELSRRWHARGVLQPSMFVALAARSPTVPADRDEPLHLLGPQAFRQALIDLGGTPKELLDNADVMSLFEPILRNDLRIAETYRAPADQPTFKLPCPLHAFVSLDDAVLDEEDAAAWADCAGDRFELHRLQGPHMLGRGALLGVLSAVSRLWPEAAP